VVVALTVLLLAHVVRKKGDRGALWVFLLSLVSWSLSEVYWVVSGGRLVTPVQLMGGVVVSELVPALLRGGTDGALPVLLAYLFAVNLYHGRLRGVAGVLGFMVLYLFVEGFFEAVGARMGVLHPAMLLLGVPVWNATYSVRWVFNPLSVGGLLLMTVLGLAVTAWKRSYSLWKLTSHYFLYLVIYTSYASLMGQIVGFKRWIGVPLLSVGFDPASMALTVLDPVQVLLRLAWVGYGLPIVLSVYPLTAPVFLMVPANLFDAVLGYFFDVTIEVAGVYLPFLAIPVALKLVESPKEEVTKMKALLHTILLLALTATPLAIGVWLSSRAPQFLSSFVQGAIGFPAFLLAGLVVLVAVKLLVKPLKPFLEKHR
ncbi:MAG: hypothetical protein KIH01_05105, partial [Candidatus Freyarchaeota archaeon]|nr:hypothetical protein [Candidatus Jordarchaeia archaeon]